MQAAITLPLPASAPSGSGGSSRDLVRRIGLFIAPAALLAVMAMPTPHGLPPAGQVMLAVP